METCVRHLRSRQHLRARAREPASGTPAICRGAGLDAAEYIDKGVSGAKDRRPSLDRLVVDARRRRFDVLVVWRLDRLGRNLKHLVTLLEDVQAVGIAFVSLGEGIDCTTAAGRLQLHVLAALAEFERARIAERGSGWPRQSSRLWEAPGASCRQPGGCRRPADWAPVSAGGCAGLGRIALVVHRARVSQKPAELAS